MRVARTAKQLMTALSLNAHAHQLDSHTRTQLAYSHSGNKGEFVIDYNDEAVRAALLLDEGEKPPPPPKMTAAAEVGTRACTAATGDEDLLNGYVALLSVCVHGTHQESHHNAPGIGGGALLLRA